MLFVNVVNFNPSKATGRNAQKGRKQMKINAFATHVRPHLSDLGAIGLFLNSGSDEYVVADPAPVFYWRGGTAAEFEEFAGSLPFPREEIMFVGIGGGECDEYPFNGHSRKENESEISLAAKLLGIDQNPPLQKFLKYVTEEDLNGNKNPFGLANLIKLRYDLVPESEMGAEAVRLLKDFVSPLIIRAFEAHYVRLTTEQAVVREDVKGCVIATVVTDDPGIAGFLFSKHGGQAAVAIIQSPTSGSIRIVANKRSEVFKALEDTVRIIRVQERKAAGCKGNLPLAELAAEGSVPGTEQWHFHTKGQMLLHGSKTHPDVPRTNPTKLSLQEIQQAVKIGLAGSFEPDRAKGCECNLCSDTLRNPCPWYGWGLSRCRTARWNLAEELRAINIDFQKLCELCP